MILKLLKYLTVSFAIVIAWGGLHWAINAKTASVAFVCASANIFNAVIFFVLDSDGPRKLIHLVTFLIPAICFAASAVWVLFLPNNEGQKQVASFIPMNTSVPWGLVVVSLNVLRLRMAK